MNELELHIRALVAERMHCTADEIGLDQDLAELGLKSLDAVIVSGELEDHLEIEIDPSTLFDNRTINAVAGAIRELQRDAG